MVLLYGNEKQLGCIIIDPGNELPFQDYLVHNNLIPKMIIITHKHLDHTFGLSALVDLYPNVEDTVGHVIYCLMIKDIASTETAVENNYALYFTGDTIFTAGVERMFEYQASIYYKSIQFFIESLLELNCQIENYSWSCYLLFDD